MGIYPGFDIKIDSVNMLFEYGQGVFGPEVEKRYLKDIRNSFKDNNAEGPEIPYVVAMDVGKTKDRNDLKERNLLYGAMIYSKGKIGDEPVRSQGHVHSISESCNSSTPEVYEIWSGEAIIYMQETVETDPGRCFAITAKKGDVVIVPPGWAHFTVNANPNKLMTFGAWCIRDYGFEYSKIREKNGLAYSPIFDDQNNIYWMKNEKYIVKNNLIKDESREYSEFGLKLDIPIYNQYENNKNLFDFVTKPQTVNNIWKNFRP